MAARTPTPAQQKAISSRGKNVLLRASAGSGKTTVLVDRLMSLIMDDHIPIDHIVAMTFTEDAAAEMKARLKTGLEEKAKDDPFAREQLNLLESASISTIHGFCLDLLQRYYYLLDIPYSMTQTVDNGSRQEMALRKAYEEALSSIDPKDAAELQLYFESFKKDQRYIQTRILDFLEIARSKPDPLKWMNQLRNESAQMPAWFEAYFILRVETMLEILKDARALVAEDDSGKEAKKQSDLAILDAKIDYLKQALQTLKGPNPDYEAFETLFRKYLVGTGSFTAKFHGLEFKKEQTDFKKMQDDIIAVLFEKRAYDHAEESIVNVRSTFIDLAIQTQTCFSANKAKEGFIDFSDMEQFACRLLAMPEVAAQLREKYEQILVDEYQDTNDLQETIISSFARANNVFRVGDIKQSIYGFRMARPALMENLCRLEDENHETQVLSDNFRSDSNLINFNNDFYARLMNVPGMDSQFSKEDVASCPLESQKRDGQPPVRFLMAEYGDYVNPKTGKKDARQGEKVFSRMKPDLIALDIKKHLKEDPSFHLRDVAILSRNSTHHNDIKKALAAYDIPSITREKKGFYTNQAVQIVLAALKCIDNPRNDVALMAMLCSPLGKVKQNQIAEATLDRDPSESLYKSLQFSSLLDPWRLMKNWKTLPLSEILSKIYGTNNFYYSYTSAQDKTNLDLLMQKACMAEKDFSLHEFLEQLTLEEGLDKIGEASEYGRDEDVVKISTIHASKGLQYKVVYLFSDQNTREYDAGSPIRMDSDLGLSFKGIVDGGLSAVPTRGELAFKTKSFLEDVQEKMRLLYVATTRAEKELVVVDAVKSMYEMSVPLSMRTILLGKGFTSWLLGVYGPYFTKGQPLLNPVMPSLTCPNIELELHSEPIERPESKPNHYWAKPKKYLGPMRTLTSETASSKEHLSWKPLSLGFSSSKNRGTLMHEMAARLPYPYQRKDFDAFAKQSGADLDEEDWKQLSSLNTNAQFEKWMQGKHAFESPYTVLNGNNLVHGYMDFVADEGNEIHIIDFKSDRVFDMSVLESRYHSQLETYKQAMEAIRPDARVHIWLYSFALEELHELN